MTTDIPDRIWIAPTYGCTEPDDYYLLHPKYRNGRGTAYIRADLHDAVVAENTRLREALVRARWWIEGGGVNPVGPMLRHIDAALKQETGHE